MFRGKRKTHMTDKPGDIPDDVSDEPLQGTWRLNYDNDSAARRALYAAQAQLREQ